MAYTPTTWATGDTVTATKLNKIEQGIANAGSAMIVNVVNNALDKTYTEIYDAITSGVPVYMRYGYGSSESFSETQTLAPIVAAYRYSDSVYRVAVNSPSFWFQISSIQNKYNLFGPAVALFATSSASGYPTFYLVVCVNETSLHEISSL